MMWNQTKPTSGSQTNTHINFYMLWWKWNQVNSLKLWRYICWRKYWRKLIMYIFFVWETVFKNPNYEFGQFKFQIRLNKLHKIILPRSIRGQYYFYFEYFFINFRFPIMMMSSIIFMCMYVVASFFFWPLHFSCHASFASFKNHTNLYVLKFWIMFALPPWVHYLLKRLGLGVFTFVDIYTPHPSSWWPRFAFLYHAVDRRRFAREHGFHSSIIGIPNPPGEAQSLGLFEGPLPKEHPLHFSTYFHIHLLSWNES